MKISPRRIEANRRNAQNSTGPRTQAGKARSRGNAVTHGLTAVVVSVEDEALVRERTIGVYQTFRPQTPFQAWVCAAIAIITIRLDRLREIEKQIRKGASWRASNHWDEDQQQEAQRIAARFPRDPSRTLGELRRSVQGCEWLIERWMMLASVADRGRWTDEQQALAHDLVGTPHALRSDPPGFTIDSDGRTLDNGENEVSFARAMLGELRSHQEQIVAADDHARQLAIADLDDFNNRDLVRVRRYERSLQTEFHRLCTLSQFTSPQSIPAHHHPSIPPAIFDPPVEPAATATLTRPAPPNEPIIPAELAVAATMPVLVEQTVTNEPTAHPIHTDKTKPLTAWVANMKADIQPKKRPDLAKQAKRERKARRRRGR